MAVAAVNCPVTATEVWKAVARATKRGPSISPTVIARKIAAARNTSKTAADTEDVVIRDSSHGRARWPRPRVRPPAGDSLLRTRPHPPAPSGTRGEATMARHDRYGQGEFRQIERGKDVRILAGACSRAPYAPLNVALFARS